VSLRQPLRFDGALVDVRGDAALLQCASPSFKRRHLSGISRAALYQKLETLGLSRAKRG
jgi:hypothetical protein